ncbi:MAG: type VI secretion system tip protein VgrG [Verrucomicrobia bacterium]|nr:type VI secretion system tip protein VgrG [Deltaproteobacteria bacterium]
MEIWQGQTSYSNGFVCIPATTIFRPHLHPKPVVTGLQSAVVVGPKGEEIHTDDHGRVRVQFHWDRLGKQDENSSCMLRVAQSWGGGGFGAQFIPRIGDEVLVDFLEGDPDRPIVTGCVYNSDNMPINSLGKSTTQSGFRTKTHKGEGFNELRFDDKNGAQEVYLQSEKDFNVLVKGSRTETVYINKAESIGVAKELSIGAGYAITVGGAMNTGVGLGQFEEVGLNKTVMIGKNFNITAGDSFSITCGKSKFSMDKAGNVTITGANSTSGHQDQCR